MVDAKDAAEEDKKFLEGDAMSIDLRTEHQRLIDLAVSSRAYQNPDEVLDQAFETIREQLDLGNWIFEKREAVAAISHKDLPRLSAAKR